MAELLRGHEKEVKTSNKMEKTPSFEAESTAVANLESAQSPEIQPLDTASVTTENQVRVARPTKDQALKKIEEVLADGLGGVYQSMAPNVQQAFKETGENIAHAVRSMIDANKWQPRKIFKMIGAWLKMISNINKYFLRQMQKIKLDLLSDIFHDSTKNM